MKTILGTRFLDIPDGVTVTCKARHVTVTPSGMSRKRVPKMVFMVRLPLYLSLVMSAGLPDRRLCVIV